MNDESEDEPLANGEADVKPDVKPALPSLDDSNGVPASSPAVPLAPSTSKTKRVKIEVDGEQLDGETDEQMARRLQSEYNGRESLSRRAAPKRSSSGVARGAKKGAKGSRSKISDEFIEDSDDENGSSSTAGPMRTAKKKSSGGGAKGGASRSSHARADRVRRLREGIPARAGARGPGRFGPDVAASSVRLVASVSR